MTEAAIIIHEVADHALPDFLARIAKLSKKSLKLLGKPITPVFHGDVVREVSVNGKKFDIDGNRFVSTFHRVSVTAETPKIHGWTFCGTIDHSHAAGNLLRAVPGASIPAIYRTGDAHCDHCDVKRRRNDTFVLRCDTDGTYKQIGRQCVRDFIGYDVTAFTESAKWLVGLEPSGDDGEGGYGGFGGKSRDINLLTFLAHVHAVIRKIGWVSKKNAEASFDQRRSTASAAIENMFPLPKYRHLAIPLTERDRAVAIEAQAYGAGLTGKTDYEYNLSIIARDEYLTHNSVGIAASMVPALFRFQEAELKRAERLNSLKGSQHLGKVGERLRDVALLLYGVYSFESAYGATTVYRFRDAQDNVVLWYASSNQELIIGDRVVLDGTIKKHDVYKGINQTVLSRCKVTANQKHSSSQSVGE